MAIRVDESGFVCSYSRNWFGTYTEGSFLIPYEEAVLLCIEWDMNGWALAQYIHNNYGYMDEDIPSFITPSMEVCRTLAARMIERVTAIGG